jgi:hypothetical protein
MRGKTREEPTVYFGPRCGMERCGKSNASNFSAERWTGIGGVADFGVVMLIMHRPHRRKSAVP